MNKLTHSFDQKRTASFRAKALLGIAGVSLGVLAGPIANAGATTAGLHISQYTAESLVHKIDGISTTYESIGKGAVTSQTEEVAGSEIPSATNIVLLGPASNLTRMTFSTFLDVQKAGRLSYQEGYDAGLCHRFAGTAAQSWCKTHVDAVIGKNAVAGTYVGTYKAAYTKSVAIKITITTRKAVSVGPAFATIVMTAV